MPAPSAGGHPIIGTDVGGTFSDAVLMANGRLEVHKQPSTPDDPADAVGRCLAALDPGGQIGLIHGTTVATNALLERRGARTGLVVTEGFRSLLAIGRGARSQLYALWPVEPPLLVPPEWVFEVDGRIAADGAIVRPTSRRSLDRLVDQAAAARLEALAVCLLFSFLDASHERRVARRLKAALGPACHVSTSEQILPEFREYERASTTTVNAYVAPIMASYLSRLGAGLEGRPWRIMASHGGSMMPAEAERLAAATVLSGPAGGVYGALAAARQAGLSHVLTFDMGGTSSDVALCTGELPLVNHSTVGGYPVHLPSVDVVTVGAGGGSLVWVDAGGWLRVGPESAGARPGPAAYDRGGRRPTVTDAHVVLGRLPIEQPLAGSLRLDGDAAHRAFAPLAASLGLSVEAAALGALAVAEAQMARALRRVSVERGVAPDRLTLVAFGGAGPMHACALAEALGCPRVLIPGYPGVLSAIGLALATPRSTAARSVLGHPPSAGSFEAVFGALEKLARRRLYWGDGHATAGPPQAGLDRSFETGDEAASGRRRSPAAVPSVRRRPALKMRRLADLRYVGQSWELTVPADDLARLPERFSHEHEERFGFRRTGAPVEVVTLRVIAELDHPLHLLLPAVGRAVPASRTSLTVAEGDRRAVPLLAREALYPGATLVGPAVIVQSDATTYVPPAWRLEVGRSAELLLTRT